MDNEAADGFDFCFPSYHLTFYFISFYLFIYYSNSKNIRMKRLVLA